MKEKRVSIHSDNVLLEGLLRVHEAFPFERGMVACHPHSLYGGEMFNPVVTAAIEAAHEEGFSTLRFNFRGVGTSGGAFDGGRGEKEDVKSAIDYLYQSLKGPSPSITFMGYSFGAWAGLPVGMGDERIDRLIAVAPPLAMYDFGFLRGCKKTKLIVAGDQDPHCPVQAMKDWYRELEEPKTMAIIEGADHFLFSHTGAVTRIIREFLGKSPPSVGDKEMRR